MPPKPKFSREEMIAAALELVSERGVEALTTRGLGEQLGCSETDLHVVQEYGGAVSRGAEGGDAAL